MKNKIRILHLACLFCLATITLACSIDIDTGSTPAEEPTTIVEHSPMPSDTPVTSSVPAGWLTYTSAEYCFEISYPPSYQALDDTDNLYGWTNGVVLFYKGGQSYDIAIQAWENQADLDANYPNAGNNISIHNTCNSRIISLNDVTLDPESASVIATFTLLP